MSNKYIIRNCPAFNDMPNMYDEIYGYCDNEHDIDLNKCMCENITDCLLKKIVELCGKYQVIDAGYQKVAINYLASDILKLLDIEEIE